MLTCWPRHVGSDPMPPQMYVWPSNSAIWAPNIETILLSFAVMSVSSNFITGYVSLAMFDKLKPPTIFVKCNENEPVLETGRAPIGKCWS